MNIAYFSYVGGLLLAFASLLASAEIYQCRDANGKATFSQTPCQQEQVAGDSEAHVLWREMQVLVNEGSAIYQLLGPDVESILNCKRNAAAFTVKLDVLDERLSALPVDTGRHLRLAQQSLRECGQCASSSQHYCNNAVKELNLQMNVLLPPLASRRGQ